jgi:hypothetical protein
VNEFFNEFEKLPCKRNRTPAQCSTELSTAADSVISSVVPLGTDTVLPLSFPQSLSLRITAHGAWVERDSQKPTRFSRIKLIYHTSFKVTRGRNHIATDRSSDRG